MSKLLAALIYQEVFYHTTSLLNNVTEPLGRLCRGIRTYSTKVAFWPNALTKHTSKSFKLYQAIYQLVIMIQLSAWSSFVTS